MSAPLAGRRSRRSRLPAASRPQDRRESPETESRGSLLETEVEPAELRELVRGGALRRRGARDELVEARTRHELRARRAPARVAHLGPGQEEPERRDEAEEVPEAQREVGADGLVAAEAVRAEPQAVPHQVVQADLEVAGGDDEGGEEDRSGERDRRRRLLLRELGRPLAEALGERREPGARRAARDDEAGERDRARPEAQPPDR